MRLCQRLFLCSHTSRAHTFTDRRCCHRQLVVRNGQDGTCLSPHSWLARVNGAWVATSKITCHFLSARVPNEKKPQAQWLTKHALSKPPPTLLGWLPLARQTRRALRRRLASEFEVLVGFFADDDQNDDTPFGCCCCRTSRCYGSAACAAHDASAHVVEEHACLRRHDDTIFAEDYRNRRQH